jgi:hypothetical protein
MEVTTVDHSNDGDDQDHGNRSSRRFRPRPLRSDGLKLWTVNDVADCLNMSPSWVYKAAADEMIPVVRLPGCTSLRFNPELIKKYARGEWQPRSRVIPLKAG